VAPSFEKSIFSEGKKDKIGKMFDELLPSWFVKLPKNIQMFIGGFILLHVLGLAVVAIMHSTSKSKPDFQAKIK
jgi:hypothetical protein